MSTVLFAAVALSMLLLLTSDQCYSETCIVAGLYLLLPKTVVHCKLVCDNVVKLLSLVS